MITNPYKNTATNKLKEILSKKLSLKNRLHFLSFKEWTRLQNDIGFIESELIKRGENG